jgi:hypothetical protein
MENFEISQVKLEPSKITPGFKTSQVKLVPCKHFPEFLENGIFLVTSDQNQILRVKEKNDHYCILETKEGKLIRLEDVEKSKELLMIFFVNGNIEYDFEPDVLFKIGDIYTISGPFDIMGDQIEEALIVDVNPNQIGNKVKKYGNYREWKSEYGLTAHQSYCWVDTIMVLDESKIREDGFPERKYIAEYTSKEFTALLRYPGWSEVINPLDFDDVEQIIKTKDAHIEIENVEFNDDLSSPMRFPALRNNKAMIFIS